MAASADSKELSIEIGRTRDRVTLTVAGTVTVESSPRLRPVLHDAIVPGPRAGIVIDFTGVRYLDTSAIATLLEAATLASEQGVPLTLTGISGEARFVVQATELDRILLALGHEVQFT